MLYWSFTLIAPLLAALLATVLIALLTNDDEP